MTWMNKGNDHICILPSQKDTWIIHGVWPNKFSKFGPFFCNSSAKFDVHELQPIMDEMRQYWLNIEKGKQENLSLSHTQIPKSNVINNFLLNTIFGYRHSGRVSVEARMVEAWNMCCIFRGIEHRE